MTVRIVGGSVRGRKLVGPAGHRFRPTTGRVKEFIFNYLGESVVGSSILDLFSGTGSLGIEALSRGASKVVFTELAPSNVNMIKKNLRLCDFTEDAKILKGDVFRLMRKMSTEDERFDIILADPPFKGSLRERIVKGVDQSGILESDGVLIVEHESHDSDASRCGIHLIKQRRFGQCVVSIYQ